MSEHKLIDSNAESYLFPDIHFKIGKRLHITPYFNFKKYFENSYYAELVAEALAERIRNCSDIPESDYTLVTYNTYSNFFISKTANKLDKKRKEKFLKNGGDLKKYLPGINYAIANLDEGTNELSFQFETEFKSKIVIVIPVGSTFSIYLNLRDRIENWLNRNGIVSGSNPVADTSFTVFLITEKNNGNTLEKYRTVLDEEKKVKIKNDKDYFSFFVEDFAFTLHSETDCKLCYTKPLTEEKYIFPVSQTTGAPELIIDAPSYNDKKESTDKSKFLEVLSVKDGKSPHVFGHIAVGYSNHLHYIKTDVFYETNKWAIREYFKNEIQKIIGPEFNSVVIFTTNRERYSPLLEDIVNDDVFGERKITIISCRPFREHTDNFSNYSVELNAPGAFIIYYTDMLWGGLQFQELDYILSKHGLYFNLLLTLVDRTNISNKTRICYRQKMTEDNILSFFKLNVSQITSTHLGNPISERLKKLHEIFENTHLDGLKLRIINQIRHCEPKTIEELEKEATKWFNPLEDNGFTRKHWNLLKLYVYHTINEILANDNNADIEDILSDENISRIAEQFFDAHKDEIDYKKKSYEADKIVKDCFIKTLSRSPFRDYMNIYEKMFEYNLKAFWDTLDEINKSKKISYTLYRDLKFFIRRTVELNSNAILSEEFLEVLKKGLPKKLKKSADKIPNEDVYKTYKKKDFGNFKYYLLYCVKELIGNDPGRSVWFEGLINSEDYLPDPVTDDTIPLGVAIQDGFYNYGRLLKMENIPLLRNFRNFVLNNSDDDKEMPTDSGLEKLRQYIYDTYFEDRFFNDAKPPLNYEHEMAIALLNKSRFRENAKRFLDIKMSMARMISILLYIKYHDKNTVLNEKKEEPIGDVLKEILINILRLFDRDVDDPDSCKHLSYGLFVEYQDGKNGKKIYSALSDKNEEEEETPDHNGLIGKMLEGILDGEKGSVQTLLPLIKDEKNRIVSFQPQNTFYVRTDDQEITEEINIEEAFNRDKIKFPFLQRARMMQYFRLAEVNRDSKTGIADKGKAVLIICSDDPNNKTSDFVSFHNVEKVRLLLLLRTHFLAYLKHNIENDAFVELINNAYLNDSKSSLTHGITYYLSILKEIAPKEDQKLAQLLTDAIRGQVMSIHTNNPNDKKKHEYKNFGTVKPKDAFINDIEFICSQEDLGDRIIRNPKIKIINFPEKINKTIYNVIIPEILINMKKKHPDTRDEIFYVTVADGIFTFVNKKDKQTDAIKILRHKGLYMCNRILSELQLKKLQIPDSTNEPTCTLILNLNSQ